MIAAQVTKFVWIAVRLWSHLLLLQIDATIVIGQTLKIKDTEIKR